jgi:hypothetical protein
VPESSSTVVVPAAFNFTKWLKPCINPDFGGFTGNGATHGGVHYYCIDRDPDAKNNLWDPVAEVWRPNARFTYKMRVSIVGDSLPREGVIHILHSLPDTDACVRAHFNLPLCILCSLFFIYSCVFAFFV